MILFPAIDILGGKAVRLYKGDKTQVTEYGDPVDFALRWADAGAEWLLDAGADRVVIGTMAACDPDEFALATYQFPEKIVAGIDAMNGMFAVKGWTQTTDISAIEFGKKCRRMGIRCALFTDIAKDGAMQGANVTGTVQMQKETGLQIIASGGISTMEDLRALKQSDVYGAVLGKALYTGAIDMKEALALAKE